MNYLGEIAALCTISCWAVSCQLHSSIIEKIGARNITLLRLPFILIILGVICLMVNDSKNFNPLHMLYIFGSSIFGIMLCDFTFFSCLSLIGPSIAVLIQSFNVCIISILAFLFLDETLGIFHIAGIAMDIVGIYIVLNANNKSLYLSYISIRKRIYAVLWGFASAFSLSINILLLKFVLREGYSPLVVSFIRVAMASILLFMVAVHYKWAKPCLCLLGDKSIFKLLIVASIFNASGIFLSSFSISLTNASTVSIIMSLQTIITACISSACNRVIPSIYTIIGSIIAVCGTILVCINNARLNI